LHETEKVPEQVQPADAVETNITPAGNASMTVASAAADGPLFFTAIVKVAVVPATSVPVCDLVTARSALVPTGAGPSTALLLVRSGSGVVDDTVAWLVSVPVAPGAIATRRSTLDVAPLASAPCVQVTTVVPPQDQPVDGDEMNVTPPGNVSTTLASAASDTPLFFTETVNVAFVPATSAPAWLFVALRSALVVIVVGPSVALLFVMSGSGVVDETVAVLVTVPVASVATETRIASVEDAPLASTPRAHEMEVVPPHDQPADEVATNVNPVGSASTIVASAASDGPLFLTTIVYVVFVPAVIAPTCDLVVDKSALVVRVVGPSVPVLFVVSGSGVLENTVAELVTVPVTLAATATTRSRVTVALLASGPPVQVTVVVPPQTQPAEGVDTNVIPVGSGSFTVTVAACDGPLFFTDTVYVTFVPARIAPVCDLVTVRSAEAPAVSARVPVLFVESGSGVVDDAVAAFTTEPVTVDAMATTMSTLASAPFARGPLVQVTVVDPVQDQPAVGDDTKVRPVVKTSTTLRSAVADGPALCTLRL
jgi:hypothetical protein